MNRLSQAILIVSTLLTSWLGMQAVHELGHVVGAWVSGGRVERVVLHPLAISRTDVSPNPDPLLVIWAGPLVGTLLPLLVWGIATAARVPGAFLLRIFAGFCCVANGVYIGVGSFWAIGDSGDMLRHGSAAWQLWLFGAAAVPIGLWLWHRQGKHFGLGTEADQVDLRTAIVCGVVCIGLIFLGLSGAVRFRGRGDALANRLTRGECDYIRSNCHAQIHEQSQRTARNDEA
jgi:hypothetical protein